MYRSVSAGFWLRAAAAGIDWAVAAGIGWLAFLALAGQLLDKWPALIVAIGIGALYLVLRDGVLPGRSLGKAVVGLRIVTGSGAGCGFWRAGGRNLVMLLPIVVPIASYLLIGMHFLGGGIGFLLFLVLSVIVERESGQKLADVIFGVEVIRQGTADPRPCFLRA